MEGHCKFSNQFHLLMPTIWWLEEACWKRHCVQYVNFWTPCTLRKLLSPLRSSWPPLMPWACVRRMCAQQWWDAVTCLLINATFSLSQAGCTRFASSHFILPRPYLSSGSAVDRSSFNRVAFTGCSSPATTRCSSSRSATARSLSSRDVSTRHSSSRSATTRVWVSEWWYFVCWHVGVWVCLWVSEWPILCFVRVACLLCVRWGATRRYKTKLIAGVTGDLSWRIVHLRMRSCSPQFWCRGFVQRWQEAALPIQFALNSTKLKNKTTTSSHEEIVTHDLHPHTHICTHHYAAAKTSQRRQIVQHACSAKFLVHKVSLPTNTTPPSPFEPKFGK